jgi:FkbM family methyltransferase
MMLLPPLGRAHAETLRLMQAGHLRVYLSQFGEDVVLWQLLRERRNGFYVDVGCCHPELLSNTALLHLFNGWRGINIDPDQRVVDEFNEKRPNDINLSMAIGREAGSAEMSFFEEPSLNTFSQSMAAGHVQQNRKLLDKREIMIRTLAEVLAEHVPAGQAIDLLDVDAEGHDLAVLEGNDWKRFRPRVVSVEDFSLRLADASKSAVFQLMSAQGYQLFSHLFSTSVYRLV